MNDDLTHRALFHLIELVEGLMASVADLTTADQNLQTALTQLQATVTALQTQGAGIAPTALDPVLASMQGAEATLTQLNTALQALVTPPAAS